MNFIENVFSGVGVVVHEHLNSLAVHVVGAGSVVGLANVGVLVSEALSEKVLLSVSRLMGDHLVLDHDVAVASLFARLHLTHVFLLLSALVETEIEVSSYNVSNTLLKGNELLLVEGLIRVHIY